MSQFIANRNTRINHAIQFAVVAHGNQVRKGNEHIPYIFHCIDVANEVIYYSGLPVSVLEKASITAILHDTVEDTAVTAQDVRDQFGSEIAQAVEAMSKNNELSKSEEISKEISLRENLKRLKQEPSWVQAVKLADRISNLKVFPAMWSREKIQAYLSESKIIAEQMGGASEGLNARLLSRIAEMRTTLSLVAQKEV